jgi:hypothetical protein
MPRSNLDHRPNGHDISFFLNERLPDLKVVDGVRELRDYSKNMFLDKVTYQVWFLR